jgi:putative flippase GtrA
LRIALYVLFAVASTAANLLAQETVITIYAEAFVASVLTGTAVGFGMKYLLDKLFVFEDAYSGAAQEARKVVLYGAFSVATTLIFWSFEAAFWFAWGTTLAKYAGAVIGLAIGYALKFWLDWKYVFRDARP